MAYVELPTWKSTPSPTFDGSVIMRKKEFIHIHALLLEVTQYLIENEDMAVEMYSTYDELDVRPSSIHKQKQNHHEAVKILGDSVERSLEQGHTESPDRPVNRPR